MQSSRTIRAESGLTSYQGAAPALASDPDFFRLLFEFAPDAILLIDPRGRITKVNTQTEKLFGYQRNQLAGQLVEHLIPRYLDSPAFGRRKNGKEFRAEIRLSQVETAEGSLTQCTVRDVTQRKQRKEFLRALIEFAPDAMVVVNPAGAIVLVNAQTATLFGYSREELIGQPVDILVPDSFKGAHPGHITRYFTKPQARLSGETVEMSGLRKDGTEFPIELRLGSVPGRNELFVISAIRDVTGRNETARAAQLLTAVIDSAEDAIIAGDLDGSILSWNPGAERMFGWAAAEAVGRNVSMLSPEGPDDEPHIFAGVVRGERIEQYESYRRRKDGTLIEVALSVSPVKDSEGNVVAWSKIVRDIRDRRRSREKEILLEEIHHRVKNNLAVISSLFFLQSTYTQDQETIKILQESQDRVRSMALVHESLYRSDDFAFVEFADYARSLANQLLHTYRLPARHIRLISKMEKVNMSIDRAVPCGLILNEMVTNSLKHAFGEAQAGEIVITLQQQKGEICLEVADNGVGLPMDIDPATARSLGVRLIRSLTQQLDGRFEIVRTQPGTAARLKLAVENNADTQ